jgi:hypothetical protein
MTLDVLHLAWFHMAGFCSSVDMGGVETTGVDSRS